MRLYKKLFLYFFLILLVLLTTISFVQYQNDRAGKVKSLESQLSIYNKTINNLLTENANSSTNKIATIISHLPDTTLRITIIDSSGVVFFDSFVKDSKTLENHLNRPEIQEAKTKGNGASIRRSTTTDIEYYYYATKFDHLFVRSALPYTVSVKRHLASNLFFIYFILFTLILASGVLYLMIRKFTQSIDRLKLFTERAERDEIDDLHVEFPRDELGEIGQNVVQLYKQLATTKNEVNNEREKLYKHLQISQEGLGIFTWEKKELLANSLFVQYTNFLTDNQRSVSDDIFQLPEFKEINQFINKRIANPKSKRKRLKIEKDGRYFLVQCIVFQDNALEISINDITKQEKSHELKSQLTQNISHELKTPVSSIMGYMESILSNPEIETERKQFYIQRSYQQALRLNALLQDISTLNKMDEEHRIYEKSPCDIVQIIDEVIRDVNLQIAEKSCNIVEELPQTMVVKGNYSLLYSIFRNLIDNALTYAGENITLKIICYREDEHHFYLSFMDNGCGVSEQHLSRLFERFYRVDKGRSRKMGGTGLGLAIVKNAVLYHNGTITAKNAVNGGLNFIFSIRKQ